MSNESHSLSASQTAFATLIGVRLPLAGQSLGGNISQAKIPVAEVYGPWIFCIPCHEVDREQGKRGHFPAQEWNKGKKSGGITAG